MKVAKIDIVLIILLIVSIVSVFTLDPMGKFKKSNPHKFIKAEREKDVKPEDIMDVTDDEIVFHTKDLPMGKILFFKPFKDSNIEIMGISGLNGYPLIAYNICEKYKNKPDGYFEIFNNRYVKCVHDGTSSALRSAFDEKAEYHAVLFPYDYNSDTQTITLKVSEVRKDEKLFKKIRKEH